MLLHDWLARARALGASDLHLESDTAAVIRVRGELQPLGAVLAADRMLQAAQDALGAEGWTQFLERGSADLALSLGALRCRASFYRTLRGIGIAVRLLTPSVRDLRACNLHPDFRRLLEAPSGLVIISGPTGAGKSTTLAALIEELNGSRARHIITLESPLEYLFTNRRALIRQREIPTHAPSFEQGIIDALRENPDVLVIGEMRTPEVMRLTLTAAETGHLVLATMHAGSCAEALQRMCLSFPADLQASVRAQLADCLVGASCQRLEFLGGPQLRVPRCELLLPSTGARGTIRAGNFSQLATVLQSGADEGLWSYARYQRWMEQQHDWVRTEESSPAPDEASTARPASLYAPPASTAARPPSPAPRVPRRSQDSDTADTNVIELPAEEIGPEELAELARQLSSRKP
ncbi:MAG TPA: ATPase, T2SS/T4P/T4SS family [Steroidobacteraceae bacterium]|jgi:twitching motility protein PilT|nr:ATPase, T2SS/T4P/T4SS family [Steroidobacteraceae bacterium]